MGERSTIEGTVENVVFQNEENGYTVLSLLTDQGEVVTVVGCIPFAAAGESMTVTGVWVNHPTYGVQMTAELVERRMPQDEEGIICYLASGVLAALYRARETGIGDRVVVSLFHSAIWDVSLILQASQYGDPTTQYPLSRRTLPNPLVVAHKTKDGKWLQIAMPQYNRHYPIFMRAIGHPEMAEDPRYYPQTNLQANIEEFYDFLVAEMATRTLDEWCALMDANDLPYAIAQTWDQLLVDKQAWVSGCFYEMEYPNGAKRTMVRPPVIFEETELPPYNRGPYLGEQTEIILKKLGYTDEQVAAMIAAGEAQPMDPALKD